MLLLKNQQMHILYIKIFRILSCRFVLYIKLFCGLWPFSFYAFPLEVLYPEQSQMAFDCVVIACSLESIDHQARPISGLQGPQPSQSRVQISVPAPIKKKAPTVSGTALLALTQEKTYFAHHCSQKNTNSSKNYYKYEDDI